MKHIHNATVTATADLATGVKKITFQPDAKFSYDFWQYVWVELPNLQVHDARGSRRAFSILNLPNPDGTISILGRISDSGYKQSLFTLKAGDQVRLHGPFGSTFQLSEQHHPAKLVFITGGVGIAAFLKHIQFATDHQLPIELYLIYLNHDPDSAPFLQELAELTRHNHRFHYAAIYEKLAESDLDHIPFALDDQTNWWISGPQGMVDYVTPLLSAKGVPLPRMAFENFYPTHAKNLTLEYVREQTKAQGLLSQAIQNSTNHTVITDANGLVLFANRAAEEITGYTFDEMIGNTPRLWGGLMSPEFYREFWKTKISGKTFQGEIKNRRKNGEIYYALAHVAPIFDDTHTVIGYIGTEEDITDIKRDQARLTASEQRLKFAIEGSRDGLWDWNMTSGEVFISPPWRKQRDISEHFDGTVDSWRQLTHPADLALVQQAWQDHLDGKTQYFETEHRLLKQDQTYLWVLDRGMVTARDSSGRAIRAVGTYTDIQATKERQEQLERMNAAMVNRELKMIQLKKELARLKTERQT